MTKLFRVGKEYEMFAEPVGVRLRNISAVNTELPHDSSEQFIASIASLKADGIFSNEGSDLVATFDTLLELESREIDPLSFLLEWSPLVLRIEATGALGFEEFKFVPRFYLGKRVVQVRAVGVIVWRAQNTYRIPAGQAIALSLIENFNRETSDAKSKANALDVLYQLKVISKNSLSIQFDEYLSSENVVKPEAVKLSAQDDGKRAIVYPIVEGVSEDELKRQFLNISDVQDVYDIDGIDGQMRQRLVISKELKEVLSTIKRRGFGISGEAREQFYRNPRSLLPEGEGVNHDCINLVGFGPRVKGIGFPAFVRPIRASSKESWFGDTPPGENQKMDDGKSISIECSFVGGDATIVDFPSTEAAEDFLSEVTAEVAKGNNSIEWNNMSIPISDAFCSMLRDQISETKGLENTPNDNLETKAKRLLIHTNEESVDYVESMGVALSPFKFSLPESLKQTVTLKDYQVTGSGWLAGLLNRDLSKGALLADDMGLGKTLQILTFLAWCIESELKDHIGGESGPYHPILVVAPLILLDNWEKETKKYFEPGLFSPFEKLHGDTLKKYRKAGTSGREVNPGEETLDIELLRRNRLIITNYETVKNYQYTFAKVPWSVLVIDEAQEIKEPSTAVTYALKVLNPIFRVASTGTPVETSLTNLWSIMDFAQPGNGLGILKEFNKEYSGFSYDDPTLGSKLRAALGFNTESGLIFRRAKKDVLKDLPPKSVVEHFCDLDAEFELKYQSIIDSVRGSERGNAAALQGLHQISQICQHPFLSEGEPYRADHRDYLRASSKLRKLVAILSEIKGKTEKALVFTRSRRMQDMLKAVLDAEFSLDVGIINGDTASRHKYIANTREGIITRFSDKPGFDVLILSPEVAGVGLTITAANHVIHYGRWWNPAKENQATDRAYRIGQTKPVFVHHLLLRDPKGLIETFDEKLHRLLKTREDLADNFLAPSGDESAIQGDLLGNIFAGKKAETKTAAPSSVRSPLARLTPFEFECASGLLMKVRCENIFVSPRSGDRGIDVVGISDKEIILIQCKKTGFGQLCQADALDELVDGADYYREYVIPKKLKHLPIALILMTTGKADRALSADAKNRGVQVVDGAAIMKMYEATSFTNADIHTLDATRPKNVVDLARELQKKY